MIKLVLDVVYHFPNQQGNLRPLVFCFPVYLMRTFLSISGTRPGRLCSCFLCLPSSSDGLERKKGLKPGGLRQWRTGFWEGSALASLLRYVHSLSSHRKADPWQEADSYSQTESEPGNCENYFHRREGL